jgi:uncharacterized membrane protein
MIPWSRIPSWLPRPSLALWGVLVAAVVETVVLGAIQSQNYLAFHSTQGDLGNYNQAFYTTVHGQGFFYFTTNIPGGGDGTLWAAHFSPTLLLLLPFYAVAPSPITLLVLKQAALAFGAIPVYGIARVYFRTEVVAFGFGVFYLLSPLTLAVDWNNFDPEAFFPVALLAALYYFTKGRLWPFLACWVLALGTIEGAPPLLILLVGGGFVGTFLARSPSPYWTTLQQRKALLIAGGFALAWLVIAYFALQLAGPRGGAFGGAYAIRYTVLGANSFPDVLPQALTHPSAAIAALQFDGARKALFVEVVILASGFVSLLGGLRYLLPLLGYLTLALLSNNSSLYVFGTQYSALVSGFLFMAAIEGAVLLADLLHTSGARLRHTELAGRLDRGARDLAARLPALVSKPLAYRRATERLKRAFELLGKDRLGSAEARLRRARREFFPQLMDPVYLHGEPGGAVVTVDPPETAHRTRLWRIPFVPPRGRRRNMIPFSFLVVGFLAATALANPLLGHPDAGGLSISFGYAGPDSHTRLLHSALRLIPGDASVLTTSHLFPELSNRPNAYVVNNGAFLPGNETIADDLNHWANQSKFIAIDYIADGPNAVILQHYTNLSGFALVAAQEGAYIYERGWSGSPSAWTPWTSWSAGADMSPHTGAPSDNFASPLGPSLFHHAGAPKGQPLWSGPGQLYLPPGNYTVTFNLELVAPTPGAQLTLRAVSDSAVVQDRLVLDNPIESYHRIVVKPGAASPVVLGQRWVNTTTAIATPTPFNVTIPFKWDTTGYLNLPGVELSTTMSMYLVSVVVTQSSSIV